MDPKKFELKSLVTFDPGFSETFKPGIFEVTGVSNFLIWLRGGDAVPPIQLRRLPGEIDRSVVLPELRKDDFFVGSSKPQPPVWILYEGSWRMAVLMKSYPDSKREVFFRIVESGFNSKKGSLLLQSYNLWSRKEK